VVKHQIYISAGSRCSKIELAPFAVRAMHADTDYKKRMEPAAIIDALKTL
jgi:prolyl-tRNA editing enzyme YbaK/EbsC (Cys-tRNA(Pro) deacylase)